MFAQVKALNARVADLEGRLVKDSRNSSKPPSSDGFKPKLKSQRKAKQKPTGDQKEHVGHTLKNVAEVDHMS